MADGNGESGYKPVVQEENGELSMSIEETNRLRASLGLKPLAVTTQTRADKAKEEHERGMAAREEREQKEASAKIRAKLQEMADKRRVEERLRSVRTLGEAESGGEDDVMAWVQRSRKLHEQQKEEEDARRQAEARGRARKRRREADGEGADEEEGADEKDGGGYSAKEMAGMKVKHAGELELGETAILTLNDRGVLDEQGNLVEDDDEQLVDAVRLQEKKREHAKKISRARKGYSGVKALEEGDTGLLAQYDEEEDFRDTSEALVLDGDGTLAAKKAREEEEVKARLAERLASVEERARQQGDYMSKEEAVGMDEIRERKRKKKSKKERRLRKKDHDEGEEGATDALIAQLEAQAEGETQSDLGTRSQRERMVAERARKEAEERDARKARFQRALDQANEASRALKPTSSLAPAAPDADGVADEDEELQASLERARLAAQKAGRAQESLAGVARSLVAKREQEENAGPVTAGGVVFTDAVEFLRGIEAADAGTSGGVKDEEGFAGAEDVDMEGGANDEAGPSGGGRARQYRRKAEGTDAPGEMPPPHSRAPETVTAERAVGRGLGSALTLLREKGELSEQIQWAGRNNDMKKVAVQEVEDALFGASHLRGGDSMEIRIENALRKVDDFGRILTPKEAWRQVNYSFHGWGASKNKREKIIKKYVEDLKSKKAASSLAVSSTAQVKEQKAREQGGAFTVVKGEIKPGQTREGAGKYATRHDD